MQHLHIKQKFRESVAKFYCAQIILALGYLHSKSIIYRDLKLENILLGDDGYIVISDFGLSKIMSDPDQMSSTFCGTAAYLAPEVISGIGYNKAVDWWALGILVFEMTHGYPPFFANNVYVMFEKIKNDQPLINKDLSADAADIIRLLLNKDPSKRLGSKNGSVEIMSHPFFSDLDWKKLQKKEITPRYKPVIKVSKKNQSGITQEAKLSDVTVDMKELIKAHNDTFKQLTHK